MPRLAALTACLSIFLLGQHVLAIPTTYGEPLTARNIIRHGQNGYLLSSEADQRLPALVRRDPGRPRSSNAAFTTPNDGKRPFSLTGPDGSFRAPTTGPAMAGGPLQTGPGTSLGQLPTVKRKRPTDDVDGVDMMDPS
ncbi:60S ribosomal protein L7 [Sphaceloma murrayae]|uniref:60S ribosomal protein L7 n=1 Tax=Sphaceloma murrayae TaxID=2082308 RepID=A0A2K1QVZ0_9PEZI|nr:60S ribosomal protein L7 [Sphaceloma murrayae]